MMDEFIYWPTPYPLLPATRDEKLSHVIDIWMKNHLASDSIHNTANLQSPPKKQGMINDVALTFSVSDTTLWFAISVEQDN